MGAPLDGHTEFVTSVAYSPDGKSIVSGSTDHKARVWDVTTSRMVFKLQGHTNSIRSVAFSPSGKYIASSSDDMTIRVWDANTGNPVGAPLKGHTAGVWTVKFSPDDKKLVSGSLDKTLRVWDVQELLTHPEDSPPLTNNMSMIKDGFHVKDGWAIGPNNELLFWVPVWCRDGLYNPKTTLVIGKRKTHVDYSKFVHGKGWEKCQTVT
jgi:WD40 repeat protein